MTCKRIELGGGVAVWTCHRAPAQPPCSACGGPGGTLCCAFEPRCGKALCRSCAGTSEPVLCPPHRKVAERVSGGARL